MEKDIIPIHLQGKGTYDYECRDKDCEYCILMSETPKPDIYYQPPILHQQIVVIKHGRKYVHWNQRDVRLIIANRFASNEDICNLFPNRTRTSVMDFINRMKRKGLLVNKF